MWGVDPFVRNDLNLKAQQVVGFNKPRLEIIIRNAEQGVCRRCCCLHLFLRVWLNGHGVLVCQRAVFQLREWRPRNAREYPHTIRRTLRTIMLLAKVGSHQQSKKALGPVARRKARLLHALKTLDLATVEQLCAEGAVSLGVMNAKMKVNGFGNSALLAVLQAPPALEEASAESETRRLALVSLILSREDGLESLDTYNEDGCNPLSVAAKAKRVSIVELLLKKWWEAHSDAIFSSSMATGRLDFCRFVGCVHACCGFCVCEQMRHMMRFVDVVRVCGWLTGCGVGNYAGVMRGLWAQRT